jgi:hypothetical protein
MLTCSRRIINSRLFKFTVGEDVDGSPSEFSIHEDAFAQLSKPLKSLAKGNSSEARAGHATWKDVSKETFERFVQYAYTGDYSIPKIEKRDAAKLANETNGVHSNGPNGVGKHVDSHESETSTAELHDRSASALDSDRCEPVLEKDDEGTILNYPSPTKKNNKKKKKRGMSQAPLPKLEPELSPEEAKEQVPGQVPAESEAVEPETTNAELEHNQETTSSFRPEREPETSHILAADFHTLSYQLLASRDNYEGTCEPDENFDKTMGYSAVLLSHASLYVFGDMQVVEPLKALSLFKLHKTLSAFELNVETAKDITDLARYAYSKEERDLKDGIGGLRGLVCQYMAIHAKELSEDKKFMNLLAEGGQIVKDFFKFQLQRIQ